MKKIIAMIIIALVAGFIGSFFTTPAIPTWYASLEKPFFTPPSWLFAPAWTTLFVLMGIASGLIWKVKGICSVELRWYWLQLALNIIWSLIFFGLQLPAIALMEIVLLWVSIFATMRVFRRVSEKAFWLMVPYLAWVTFASLLNFGVMALN